MTLKDHYALCFRTHASFGALYENLNEDRFTQSATKISLTDCRFWQIRFMRIFAGVPWRGGIKHWVIENVDIQGFRTLRLRHLRKWDQHYYVILSLVANPLHWRQNTWPWMAILRSVFTITHRVSAISYIFIIELFIEYFCCMTSPAKMCGSGPWKPSSAEYCGSFVHEKLRALHRRKFGTLTNTANISI